MANNKRIVAPGITQEEYWWGYWLRGTKEALLAGGFAAEDWFITEDEFDNRGRKARQKKFVFKGIAIETSLPAHGPAAIRISFSAEDAQARWHREQLERDVREAEVRYQYHDYARELTGRLQSRYPQVRIVNVDIGTMSDGTIRQSIRFQATKSHLLAAGLATETMFTEIGKGDCKTTELGCGYSLCDGLDSLSTKGCWDLFICTGELPRGDRHLTKKRLRETAKMLEQIFAKAVLNHARRTLRHA